MTDTTLTPEARLKLSADERRDLAEEIRIVKDEHQADTMEFMRSTVIIRRLYNLVARKKSWPWKGAANFIVPIIRFIVDHYIARLKQSFRQTRDIWHATHEGPPPDPEGINWKRASESAATFLNGISHSQEHLNLNAEFFQDVIPMLVLDGNVPIKVHFFEDFQRRWVVDGGKRRVIDVPTDRRVVWDPIPIHQTIWELGASSPKDSAVFGHWMEFSRPRFRSFLRKNNIPKDVQTKALESPDTPYYLEELRILDDELGLRKSDSRAAKSAGVYRVFELQIEWARGDDPPAMLKVWYHNGSQQILDAFTMPLANNTWKLARFIRRGKQFLASGIAEPLKVLNLQANTVVNQATDSQTIANARGLAYKAGGTLAKAIQKTGVFPGFRVPFDEDFRKEIGTIELGSGNISASNLALLNFSLQMAEMIGKVGPSQLGSVQSASRVSASVGLGVLQEGNQLIDSVVASFKDTLVECAYETLYLYAAHAPEVFSEFLPEDKARELLDALGEAEFAKNVRLNLTVTSANASREKDKQDLIVLSNFLLGIYDRIVANSVHLANPNIPPQAKAIGVEVYKSLEAVVTEIIKAFEQFKDPTTPLSPEIRVLMESMVTGQPMGGSFMPRVEEGGAGPGMGGALAGQMPGPGPGPMSDAELDEAVGMAMGMAGPGEEEA